MRGAKIAERQLPELIGWVDVAHPYPHARVVPLICFLCCYSMADDTTGETKPQPKQEGSVINLVVKDQTGAEVHFKVRAESARGSGTCA